MPVPQLRFLILQTCGLCKLLILRYSVIVVQNLLRHSCLQNILTLIPRILKVLSNRGIKMEVQNLIF